MKRFALIAGLAVLGTCTGCVDGMGMIALNLLYSLLDIVPSLLV